MDEELEKYLTHITSDENAKSKFEEVLSVLKSKRALSLGPSFKFPERLRQKTYGNEALQSLMKLGVAVPNPQDSDLPLILIEKFDQLYFAWETESNKDTQVTSNNLYLTPIPFPVDIDIIDSDTELILKFPDGKKLEFVNLEKPTAKYFKLLLHSHGIEVKHSQTKQFIKDITKQQIKNLVKALRKKIQNASLSSRVTIHTQFHGGYELIISTTK